MAGLRERKKAETRRQIAAAALRLFTERGFDAVTVEDIAAAAGVSRRTVFRYFPSKESVAFPDDDLRRARFLKGALSSGAPTPQGRVVAGFLAVSEEYAGHREVERRKHAVISSSPALVARQWRSFQAWEAVVAQALLGPRAAPPARAERLRVLAAALTAVFGTVLRSWVLEGAEGALVDHAQSALLALTQSFEEAARPDPEDD